MYKLPQTLLCNKIMLCLKETIVTSLITNKLFNSYTLLPSSVSCVQVSNHKRTELSDFDEKTLNPGHQTNDKAFKIRKPTGLFEAYSTRCRIAFAVIHSRKQRMESSSDEALNTLKDQALVCLQFTSA